jgi:acid phosphatase (class A)
MIILRRNAMLIFVSFVVTVFLFGCDHAEKQSRPAAVKEIRPGLLEGYLSSEELPNSLELLPQPPAEGSAAFALDRKISRDNLNLHGTDRWNQAMEDADLHFPEAVESYAAVIGIPITEEDTPYLYVLLRRTLTDAGLSTYAAKDYYIRTHPFMENGAPTCSPEEEELLRNDGSYPSGHTAIGWAWALVLCEIFPEHTDAIIARGRDFGQSRVVCNVHWQSDVNEGRFMGAATVARLHGDPEFLADLAAAKMEIANRR